MSNSNSNSDSDPDSAPMVAVLTASSTSGAACVASLLANHNAHPTRALFRSEAKAAALRNAQRSHKALQIHVGVDAAVPATLVPPLQGCAVAFLVTPFAPQNGIHDDAALVANMMNAAVQAGVRHIIYGASWTVNEPHRVSGLAGRFLWGEKLLRELEQKEGITWTVLRGGFYHSNFEEVLGQLRGGDEVRFTDICVPSNDPADIGRVAAVVAAAGGKGYEGKVFEISGPARLWTRQIVRITGEELGREVRFVDVGAEKSFQRMPPFLKQAFQYLVDVGEKAVPISESVRQVTGKAPVSFREWVGERKADYVLGKEKEER